MRKRQIMWVRALDLSWVLDFLTIVLITEA